MKETGDKEHRISNLKNLINNLNEKDSYEDPNDDDIEEDIELINYLNEDTTDYDVLGINDKYIYHPHDNEESPINLEENPIDEKYIINTPKTDETDDSNINEYSELEDLNMDFGNEISENFDNVLHAKIGGKPILAIISTITGIIFIIISVFVFKSRSDRIIDNVVSGESNFLFIIFLTLGSFLLIYGIFKLFNLNNPFRKITDSIDSIDKKKEDKSERKDKKETQPTNTIPASKEPIDKESYKIGEFTTDDLKTSPKKSEKNETNLITREIEEIEYEQVKLNGESIDEIFANINEDFNDSNEK